MRSYIISFQIRVADLNIDLIMSNRIFNGLVAVFFIGLLILIIQEMQTSQSHLPKQIEKLRILNNKTSTTLHELVKTKFFRIIRLNLNSQCPLPYVNKLCASKSCSVCRCNEKDIPQNWMKTDKVMSKDSNLDVWSQQRDSNSEKWVWHVQDQENDKGQYFDVNTNVQSYSGYNGTYIWSLIYEQNCFKGPNHFEQMCLEQQVLYKIISGLHTSISSHLSRLFKNITKAAVWADKGDQDFFFNHYQYNRRVIDHPERIRNLVFLYQILIRSVKAVIPYLQKNNIISSDNIAEDLKATKLMGQLLTQIKNTQLKPLKQTDAFFFEQNNFHVKQYQKYIHNISSILNCVDCQKCRLFGKMQTYGLGTALKILLGYNTQYKRNQIVAMFNTLNKVSISVNTYFNYENFRSEGMGGEKFQNVDYHKIHNQKSSNGKNQSQFLFTKIWAGCGLVFLLFLWIVLNFNVQAKVKKNFKNTFPPANKKRVD